MSLLKVNEVQNYNGSSLTLTASTVSTSAQLNTGGNVSVTGSINVSDDSTTRSNLGLGSIATQDSDNVTVTGGTATLGALTVSGSDSGDLVRITQTGSGNALVVEDSANPDSTPFVVDSSGNVGIGTSSPDEILHISGDTAEIKLTNTNPIEATGGTEQVFKIGVEGQKSNVYGPAGSIIFRQNGTWSAVTAEYKPTSIEFCTQDATATDNSETPRMRINSSGDIYSTAWTIKIWTLGGVSSTSATVYRGGYKRIGKMVFIHGFVQGVSNATTFTITNLPYAPKSDAQNVSYQSIDVSYGLDNGVFSTSPVTAYLNGNISSTNLTLLRGFSPSGWTASGNKSVVFSGWYEAESI